MNAYFAHSPKDGAPAQSYEEHINGVFARATHYAEELHGYGKSDVALLANLAAATAMFHDLGKLDKDNQRVLSGEKKGRNLPKNHVDAGCAYFLDERHLSMIAAAVVAAHHRGFHDFVEESTKGNSAFRDEHIMREVDSSLAEFERMHDRLVESGLTCADEMPVGNFPVFLRLLLSCLVDADHTDTAVHYGKHPVNEDVPSLRPAERLARLDNYVSSLGVYGDSDNVRDMLRSEMYSACRNAQPDVNIVSCSSPVGSGKTTAVMAHLLAQAHKRGLCRIFVVLPFTNIIRQSVEIYRNALCLPGENPAEVVAELHHRADFESEDERHLTALWRAPIIVTTAVTFFETLASNSPPSLRRLHELPGSAVFVDESHAALPAKLLPLAWKWINVFAEEWSCYWILASGSLNRFWEIEEISDKCNLNVPEIVREELRTKLSSFEENRVCYKHDLTPKNRDEIMNFVTDFEGPRLVIVNTVQSAAVIADYFSGKLGPGKVEHLSTALTPKDRAETLARVKKRLQSQDNDWSLIATSCVEAGVDFSFRVGFRELASLASLLQTAGRINRDGKCCFAEIWTFCLSESDMLIMNPGIKGAAKVLREYFDKNTTITPDLTTEAIEDEIKLYGVGSLHKKLIDAEVCKRFPCVEKNFKVIESDTRITVIDSELSEKIRCGNADWRELQLNSVQIAAYKLRELNVPKITESIHEWTLGYNSFLGYMEGIIRQKKLTNEVLVI
jgi:CRISPR-associated endonuclease Cas3-HD